MPLHGAEHDREWRGDGERDEGEDPVVGQHDGGNHQHQRTVEQPRQATPLEELGQRLDVAGDAGDERAASLLVVVGEADAWMCEIEARPQFVERLLRALPEPDDRLPLGDASDREGDAGDRRQRGDERDVHAAGDAAVDGLLQEDGDDDPACRPDGGEAPGDPQPMAQHRRFVQAAADRVHRPEPPDWFGHDPPPTTAPADSRSASNASTSAR